MGNILDISNNPGFIFNPAGSLEVSSSPRSSTIVTGSITAVGSTVVCNVSNSSSVVFACSGTFSAVNCTFEASIDGGTTFTSALVARSDSNVAEVTTGSLSVAPAYMWKMNVAAYTHVRVRGIAWTSGTQVWRILPGAYATEPVPVIPTHGVISTPATGTTYNLVTAASTNAATVKSSAGGLFEVTISNVTATATYAKFYNKASAPTVGTDIPVLTIPVAAGATVSMEFGALGKRFATGIAFAATAAAAATDTAAAVAGVQVNATYL